MINVIGSGMYGCVIKPPLPCGKNVIPENSVGKIAEEKVLKREYNFMKKYQKYTIQIPYVKLCKLTRDQYDFLQTNIPSIELENPYQLIMPYLGESFYSYFVQYENPCFPQYELNPIRQIIDIQTFKHYFEAIHRLLGNIVILNDNRIFHNDITLSNMVYHQETNELLLIDFNLSISNEIPEEYAQNVKYYTKFIDKYKLLNEVVIHFLHSGFMNKYIYNTLKDKYIEIQTYDIYVTNFLKGIIEDNIRQQINDMNDTLIRLMNELFEMIFRLDDTSVVDESNPDNYCKIKNGLLNKIPASIQRENAKKYMSYLGIQEKTRNEMGQQDIFSKKHVKRNPTAKKRLYRSESERIFTKNHRDTLQEPIVRNLGGKRTIKKRLLHRNHFRQIPRKIRIQIP